MSFHIKQIVYLKVAKNTIKKISNRLKDLGSNYPRKNSESDAIPLLETKNDCLSDRKNWPEKTHVNR